MKNNLFFAILILVFASCTASQKVCFNKNWSGSVNTTLDFTELYNNMGEAEAPALMEDTANIRKVDRLKKIKGISNVKVESVGNSITHVSYDFKNIDALNLSGNLLYNDVDYMKNTFFALNNGDLLFTIPGQNNEGEDDMGMGDLFFYRMEIETKRKITAVQSACDSVEHSSNRLMLNTTLTELMNNGCKELRISFK